MKYLAVFAASLGLAAGCESGKSKLDGMPDTAGKPGASAPAVAGDHSGDVETRLRRLEDSAAKNAEALDFLNKVYNQQKAQQKAQQREVPDPEATFAVDISDDIKAGQVEGSSTALVTIVEAWDFA